MLSLPNSVIDGLEQAGVALTDEQIAALCTYVDLLERRGQKLNLLSRGDMARVWERHIFDSLAPLPLIGDSVRLLADLGSGAGLPGIPIAIARPKVEVVLVERTRKRCAFLMQAVREIGLENARVLWKDVDSVSNGSNREAGVVAVRAVADTMTALTLAKKLLHTTGSAMLWQTRSQMEREPVPQGWEARWTDMVSLDGIERGIRVCRPLQEGA
jgi:16S rRNA (guanine527-N7)-methyltransferase